MVSVHGDRKILTQCCNKSLVSYNSANTAYIWGSLRGLTYHALW